MPTPFPGMDPYLESHYLWPDLKISLSVAIAHDLGPLLRPKYYVAIEEHTYIAEPPATSLLPSASSAMPDEVRETYLEVRSASGGEVITLLEILSPTNKRTGEGRSLYLRKRRAVIAA